VRGGMESTDFLLCILKRFGIWVWVWVGVWGGRRTGRPALHGLLLDLFNNRLASFMGRMQRVVVNIAGFIPTCSMSKLYHTIHIWVCCVPCSPHYLMYAVNQCKISNIEYSRLVLYKLASAVVIPMLLYVYQCSTEGGKHDHVDFVHKIGSRYFDIVSTIGAFRPLYMFIYTVIYVLILFVL
jgi:hypothetical protein